MPTSETVSGIVTDSSSRPVGDGYVIGLTSLTVARTDPSGRYSMKCLGEPLVAASWLVQFTKPGPHPNGITFGIDTTASTEIPSTPGPGYVFSGGASEASQAASVACDGHPANFTLGAGGSVDVTLLDSSGQPLSGPPANGPPIDNFYLPGLGDQAALALAPVDATGHQILAQLGPGVLRIDGTMARLSCSGPGVTPAPDVAGATVNVVPGETILVTCQESSPPGPGPRPSM